MGNKALSARNQILINQVVKHQADKPPPLTFPVHRHCTAIYAETFHISRRVFTCLYFCLNGVQISQETKIESLR